MLPKVQIDFFSGHQWALFDGWIGNRKEISVCSTVVQSGTDVITKHKKEHEYSIFFKNISEGKNKFFAMSMPMPIPMMMLIPRCQRRDLQMAELIPWVAKKINL